MIDPHDRLAILALYSEYNRAIDTGDATSWASTFHADGVFEHPSETFIGRSRLEAFVVARNAKLATHNVIRQRHWNDEITFDDAGGEVLGRCLLLVAGVDRETNKPSVIAMGSYVDRIVRQGSQWRFMQRTLRMS